MQAATEPNLARVTPSLSCLQPRNAARPAVCVTAAIPAAANPHCCGEMFVQARQADSLACTCRSLAMIVSEASPLTSVDVTSNTNWEGLRKVSVALAYMIGLLR
jgi:hypothetical protein